VTAGNFPVAVPSWYLVPALLCGNAVVWKPAEYTPAIAGADLFVAAGLPDGVLNTVLARGPTTFDGLSAALDAGLVDKICFTGSCQVGTRIGELAGRHLQTPCLELGGKNPLVVMPDAELDLAVDGALFSGFGTAGQRCTSLGTVVVHSSVHDEFLRRFDAAVRAAPIGDPTAGVLYGPMISSRFLEGFLSRLDLLRPHHTLHGSTHTGRITAGSPREGFVGDPEAGLYAHPTIVDGVRGDDAIACTETFGPIVGVASFATFDEAVALANGHGYGLSVSIYTIDPGHAFRFRERVSAGDGQRQQLDLRGRGAPAVRGQRPLRERGAPVRHLGARPVHPLAVAELGLLGPAAEGTAGHRGRRRRPRGPGLPPAVTVPGRVARHPGERRGLHGDDGGHDHRAAAVGLPHPFADGAAHGLGDPVRVGDALDLGT
jgi:hypothetical protein